MTLDELRSAMAEFERTQNVLDRAATDLARALVRRLRSVQSQYVLEALKRELKDYNIHTGSWKQ